MKMQEASGQDSQALSLIMDWVTKAYEGRLKALEDRVESEARRIGNQVGTEVNRVEGRLDSLDDKLLSRWDVALVVSAILSGIFLLFGAAWVIIQIVDALKL